MALGDGEGDSMARGLGLLTNILFAPRPRLTADVVDEEDAVSVAACTAMTTASSNTRMVCGTGENSPPTSNTGATGK